MAIVMRIVPDFQKSLCSPYHDGIWDLIPNVLHTHCHQRRPSARPQTKCAAEKCPAEATKPQEPERDQKRPEETVLGVDSGDFVKSLDVREYRPHELDTKMVGNSIIVEGRHEEREDGYGSISRHFVRRYVLPKEFDAERVKVSLSEEGQLTIRAPRHLPAVEVKEQPQQQQQQQQQEKRKEVVVAIRETGQPHARGSPAK